MAVTGGLGPDWVPGPDGLPFRRAARVILLDDADRVLLVRGHDVDRPQRTWWFTVGGEVRNGERLAEAAARELAEETGLRVAAADMVGPVWRRDEVFEFNGSLIDSEEFFFVHRTHRFEPSGLGRTGLERRYIHGHRWCDADDIAGLVAAGQTVYPRQLSELLSDAAELAGGRATGQLQSIR